ncbi:hypothetical protein [Aureimonas pseudogalii]|uniref:Acetyl-CoA carboxylase carboxyltransferase component n=1 Tax=Aureimonas pseudogalii TaxID=1744844 RepID=A0A7W6EH41_9HYPH|nr:hypothetical protein [Aureimonas pseudogalii]MBB3997949.1 acetyl-CoA carboxylase carboxyltransferase component [Aureimonas pseudogalii]
MAVLGSSLAPRSAEIAANRAAMRAQMHMVEKAAEVALAGGGAQARARHLAWGKPSSAARAGGAAARPRLALPQDRPVRRPRHRQRAAAMGRPAPSRASAGCRHPQIAPVMGSCTPVSADLTPMSDVIAEG